MITTDLVPVIKEWISTGSQDADDLARMIGEAWRNEQREKTQAKLKTGLAGAIANGVKFGRPKVSANDRFIQTVARWRAQEMSAVEAFRSLGMSKNTFYRRVKELESAKGE